MCAWSGGNFTRANPTWTTDASLGIGIEAGRHDAQDNDFTTGIDQCLNKTGQNSMTGDLNLGGYKAVNAAAGTAAAPAICAGNDVNTGMYSPAADEIGFATNGSDRVRITSTGRVGIGTTTPSSELEVQAVIRSRSQTPGGTVNLGINQFSADSAGTQIEVIKSRGATIGAAGAVSNGDSLFVLNNYANHGSGNARASYIQAIVDSGTISSTSMPGALIFATTPNGSTTTQERMRIDANGATGISTQGDTASETVPGLGRPQLQVKGTGTIGQIAIFSRPGNGDAAFLTFCKSRGSTTGSYTAVQTGDGLGHIGFLGATGTDFRQGAAIQGVQDGGTISATSMPGRLVFLTTPDGDTVPTERMRIDRAGRVGLGVTGPTYQLQLSSDSAAKPTTNTWTIASDERIKTNVQPYAKGLAEICQVNPITYDYNGKGGIPAGPGGVSILAQELQPVFPECVGSYKAKLNEDDEDETDILNYNGHAVTFALINAVKELNAKVEALEAKVENLEAVTAGL